MVVSTMQQLIPQRSQLCILSRLACTEVPFQIYESFMLPKKKRSAQMEFEYCWHTKQSRKVFSFSFFAVQWVIQKNKRLNSTITLQRQLKDSSIDTWASIGAVLDAVILKKPLTTSSLNAPQPFRCGLYRTIRPFRVTSRVLPYIKI